MENAPRRAQDTATLGSVTTTEMVQPSLSGRLRQNALAPMLEFLMATGHTGTLELEGPGEHLAELSVESGNIIFAAAETEDSLLRGMDAIRAVLRWKYAYVTLFDTPQGDVKTNVTGSIMHVLLEAARLEDESQRDEPTLPVDARLRIRFNVEAYKKLGQSELFILNKVKPGITLTQLKESLGGMPVEATVLELIKQRLLEVEGYKARVADADDGSRNDSHDFFSKIVPQRVHRPGNATSVWGKAQNPFHEIVYALVDGVRSAEAIRADLRLSPGVVRDALQSLRAQARIDY